MHFAPRSCKTALACRFWPRQSLLPLRRWREFSQDTVRRKRCRNRGLDSAQAWAVFSKRNLNLFHQASMGLKSGESIDGVQVGRVQSGNRFAVCNRNGPVRLVESDRIVCAMLASCIRFGADRPRQSHKHIAHRKPWRRKCEMSVTHSTFHNT